MSRRRDDSQQRVRTSARISMLRAIGVPTIAVMILAAAPFLANRVYQRDVDLLRTGTVSEVTVTETERGFKGECRRIFFLVDGRERNVCDHDLDPGETVRVVSDGKRVLKADRERSRRADVLGGTAFGGLIAAAIVGFGLGPGMAPRRAWWIAARRRPTLDQCGVEVISARSVVPPQGRLYARWRRSRRRHGFYELTLRTADGHVWTWTGNVPTYIHHLGAGAFETRCWVSGHAQLVGEVRLGGWAWLVPAGRRRVCSPVAPMRGEQPSS